MQQVGIALNQIAIMGAVIFIGFIAGRTRYLPENASTVIAQMIVRVSLPALIVSTMYEYEFSPDIITSGLIIVALGVVFMTISFFLAKWISLRYNMPEARRNIYRMLFILSNVGFLAVPLVQAVYGEKGLVYTVFYMMGNDIAIWTVGLYFINRHNLKSKGNFKVLLNPNLLSFIIGIALVLLNVRQYVGSHELLGFVFNSLHSILQPLGKVTTPLSMIFIGLILSEVKFDKASDLLKRGPLFVLAFIKLLLLPLVALLIISLFIRGIHPLIRDIIVLLLAMPSASVVPMISAQANSDYKFAAEGVFITTVLSVATLPLMFMLMGSLQSFLSAVLH